MNSRIAVLVVLMASTFIAAAEKKPRSWQEGMLKDVSTEKGSRVVGSFNNGAGAIHQRRDDATYYEIQTSDYTYVAKRTLTSRGDKQLSVTINDLVKFSMDGDNFYLLDEKGKEHKLSLERKVRRTSAESSR